MNAGNKVILSQYGNASIERIVVCVENGRIYVCKPDEFAASQAEHREPVSVGFRLEDLIGAGQR
jgi:hypothetical protein